MTPSTTGRLSIWLKTAAVTAAYAGFIWAVDRLITSRWIYLHWLSLAIAFTGAQITLSMLILLGIYVRRSVVEMRRRRVLPVIPHIQRLVASHAGGVDSLTALKPLLKRCPVEFEAELYVFICNLRGRERDRLCELAADLGLVERWISGYDSRNTVRRRQALDYLAGVASASALQTLEKALDDPDESLRLSASRALLAVRGREVVEKIFFFSLRQGPVVRALIADDLRPYLLMLSQKELPEAVASEDPQHVLAALDMIWSWGRVIDVPQVAALFDSKDSVIRAVALHAGYYAAPQQLVSRLPAFLEDPAPIVRRAAAETCGQFRLEAAVTSLMKLLHDDDERVARAAAKAVARLGETGLQLLDQQLIHGTPAVAGVALEAAEKARIGRMEWE
jgi:HEAT repeat protein